MSRKIRILTLGCSKNLADSEILSAQLTSSGCQVTHGDENADIVIVNTCGFIRDAKTESIDAILQQVYLKETGKIEKLYVMGCLSQRYKADLEKEIPEVDAFFGVYDMPHILQELGEGRAMEKSIPRDITTGHYAYVKIAEGCDRRCSFCAIPLIKGRHISRPMEDILDESGYLTGQQVKEIILISQDLNYYGRDLYHRPQLNVLIKKIAALPRLGWLRLHYLYPVGLTTELIQTIYQNPHICNYLDVPFQHISDPLLNSMKRGITKKQSYELVEKIRKYAPGMALRTSLMVGYPGETEEMFAELVRFVREVRFQRLGIFRYSHEEGTRAFSMWDAVPENVKQERMEEIMAIQQDISLEINRSKVGGSVNVLIDRVEGDYLIGRTAFDSPEIDNEVLIENSGNENMAGTFCRVRITGASEFDLTGQFEE